MVSTQEATKIQLCYCPGSFVLVSGIRLPLNNLSPPEMVISPDCRLKSNYLLHNRDYISIRVLRFEAITSGTRVMVFMMHYKCASFVSSQTYPHILFHFLCKDLCGFKEVIYCSDGLARTKEPLTPLSSCFQTRTRVLLSSFL